MGLRGGSGIRQTLRDPWAVNAECWQWLEGAFVEAHSTLAAVSLRLRSRALRFGHEL